MNSNQTSAKQKRTIVAVDELYPHPRYDELFLSRAVLTALAEENSREYAQPTEVHVTADLCVLAGQDIVKGALATSQRQLPACIHTDVSAKDRRGTLMRMIRLQSRYRALTDMEAGRCYRALRQEFLGDRQRLTGNNAFAIRLAVCANRSEETLQQLGRLASLPRDIHDRIDSNKMTRRHAERIRKLRPNWQALALSMLETSCDLENIIVQYERLQANEDRFENVAPKQPPSKRTDPFKDPNHLKSLLKDHFRYS